MNTWINELKVGDRVFVTRNYGATPVPDYIKRETNNFLVVSTGAKFSKTDGIEHTSDIWNRQRLLEPCLKLENAFTESKLQSEVRKLISNFKTPSDTTQLLCLIDILSKHQQ